VIELCVNGARVEVDGDPGETLASVLRNRLALTGTRVGCAIGYCGACTVLVDGLPGHACCLFVGDMVDRDVTTIEALRNDPVGEAVIDAMVACGAIQCGYCSPGFVVSATALVREVGMPSEEEVREHLVGNMCRCTGYTKIVQAISRVSKHQRTGAT